MAIAVKSRGFLIAFWDTAWAPKIMGSTSLCGDIDRGEFMGSALCAAHRLSER